MARLKRPEITKHHVLRITDWTYSCVLVIYGGIWTFIWARLGLHGKAILMQGNTRLRGGTTARPVYPITMWLFAIAGACVVAVGIRNIRRLLANQSIG